MTTAELFKVFTDCSRRITTDSRNIQGGEIFAALKGENFDGNSFALQALEKGAAYALVNEDSEIARSCSGGSMDSSVRKRIIIVPDTFKALRQLATYNREHTLHDGRRIPMLALTGTNGKTTTKELIKAVLQTKYALTATEGNFNNNLGVPLTLLRIDEDTEFAVVEMGASHPGDIRELVDIARPDFGLVTNVGRAHLLGFGSFEGVKKTKGELFDYVSSVNGKCFINSDSGDILEMAAERGGITAIPYGKDIQQAEVLPVCEEQPFLRIRFKGGKVLQTGLVGSYNLSNVLAALAVGREFGVDEQAAFTAIAGYVPSNSRSQMVKTEHNTLIVDAYNANPSSMAAAIENFSQMKADKKALMLGDMLELGQDSAKEHQAIIEKALSIKPQLLVLVGNEFGGAFTDGSGTTFTEDNCSTKTLRFPDSVKAAEYFAGEPLCGYTILIKGSRGTRMENILKQL